eukprot:450075-Pleurochrysis_carterae.AAC.2
MHTGARKRAPTDVNTDSKESDPRQDRFCVAEYIQPKKSDPRQDRFCLAEYTQQEKSDPRQAE